MSNSEIAYSNLRQGIEQVQQENYAAALPFLNACLDNSAIDDSERLMALYYRGLTHSHLNDWYSAITDYTNALKIDGISSEVNHSYINKLRFGLAMAWVSVGDYRAGLVHLETLANSEADHGPTQQLLGVVHKKLWQMESSSSHNSSTNSITNLNASITAYKRAASAFLAQDDEINCRRCIEAYQELQTKLPPTPSGLLESAAQKLKSNDFLGALIDLNFVVQLTTDNDPLYAKGLALRGVVHSKLKNLTSAMADLNQALVLSPYDVEVKLTRGIIRSEMGDTQGAIADFTELIRDQPSLPQTYISRGLAYQKLKNYRQAIEDFSRGLSLNEQPEWYCDRGQARYNFGDIRGAIDDYQRAADLWFNQSPTSSLNMASYQNAIAQIKRWQPELERQKRDAARQQTEAIASLSSNPNQMPSMEIQERLLRLVGGNMAIAQRLLDIAKQDHPNMPEEWYWKKVIFDIESTLPEE